MGRMLVRASLLVSLISASYAENAFELHGSFFDQTKLEIEIAHSILHKPFVVGMLKDNELRSQSLASYHFELSNDEHSVHLVNENTRLRTSDPEMKLALREGIATHFQHVLPILQKKSNTIIMNAKDLVATSFHLFQFNRPTIFCIEKFDVYATNFNLQVAYTDIQDRNVTQLFFSLMLLPSEVMRPRSTDPRVGYQFISFLDLGIHRISVDRKNPTQQYIHSQHIDTSFNLILRHRLDSNANGDVINPIVFYIDTSIPILFYDMIQETLNAWNVAFERIGLKGAVKAIFPHDRAWPEDYNLRDLRFNTIAMSTSSIEEKNFPVRNVIDPRTGQILTSKIALHSSSKLDALHCQKELSNKIEILHVLRDLYQGSTMVNFSSLNISTAVVRENLMHELGHAFGLQHNLAGSLAHSPQSLQTLATGQVSSSIMDLLPLNLWSGMLKRKERITLDQLFQTTLGPYDLQAIAYGYTKNLQGSKASALLKTIPRFYPSDNREFSPAAMEFDLSSEPIEYFIDRIEIVKVLQNRPQNVENQHVLLRMLQQTATNLAKYIGGIHLPSVNHTSSIEMTSKHLISKQKQQSIIQQILRITKGEAGILGSNEKENEITQKFALQAIIRRLIPVSKLGSIATLKLRDITQLIRENLWQNGTVGSCPKQAILEYHIQALVNMTTHRFSLSTIGFFELNVLHHRIKTMQVIDTCPRLEPLVLQKLILEGLKDYPIQPESHIRHQLQANTASNDTRYTFFTAIWALSIIFTFFRF